MRIADRLAAGLGIGFLAIALPLGCGDGSEARSTAAPPAGPAADGSSEAELAALRARIAELEAELSAPRSPAEAPPEDERVSVLQAQVTRLCADLDRERSERIAREREWLQYGRAVASLELEDAPEEIWFVPLLPEVPPPPEEAEPPAEREPWRVERARELHRSLRTMLTLEQVRGVDLLEVGEAHDGWVGPVVFRLLDGSGRLAGGLLAERLRLEGSRTARTLTLVLEDGYESRGGQRTPFEGGEGESAIVNNDEGQPAEVAHRWGGGVRRIVLPQVDPTPWVEAMPELFGGESLEEPLDDGLWDAERVRRGLNELLREDASTGFFRVRRVSGIFDGQLREVHLESRDREGRLDRRLFADRMRILPHGGGVQILLEDGAWIRGDEKTAFLEGRYRIFLPRAELERWRAAGLPGLAEPPGMVEAGG